MKRDRAQTVECDQKRLLILKEQGKFMHDTKQKTD